MMTTTTTQRPPFAPAGAEPPRSGLSLHTKIDLCRGLFAALVVLCHGFTTAWGMDPDAPASIAPAAYLWLLHSFGAGFYWVMGFFVLSGYCIHLSVDRQVAAGRFSPGRYLIARFTRILPLYYLALAFAIGVEAVVSTWRDGASDALDDPTMLLGQLFAVHNLIRCYPGFVASWSITNEVFYYVLYGGLACLAAGRRDRPVRLGLALCLAVGIINQVIYELGGKTPLVLRSGLLFGLGAIWFLGAGVAVYRERLATMPVALALARAWPVVLAAGIVAYHYGVPIQAAYVVSGLAFAGMMVRMAAGPGSADPVAEPGWAVGSGRFLGLASYPTYLFHAPLLVLLSAGMSRMGWQGDWRINWAVLTLACLAAGSTLGWWVERPLMHWRGALLARVRSPRAEGRAALALAWARPGGEVGR